MSAKPQPYSSTERILDILLTFGETENTLSAQDIGRRFGLSRSSAYRYLQMLKQRGLIEEAVAAGHYGIGPKLLRLIEQAHERRDLVTVARPYMEALAKRSGESVLLTRRVGHRVAVLAAIDSPQVIRVAMSAARDLPLTVGSFSKVHLAWLGDSDREAVLSESFATDSSDPAVRTQRLKRDLAKIREAGFATSEGEVETGMCSLSVPIVDRSGQLLAALTVAGPSFRLRSTQIRELLPLAQDAARSMARDWEGETDHTALSEGIAAVG